MSNGRDQESPQIIKQQDRLLSRILSRENARVNSSSRVYYYGGASVPFVWESQPGTPKHTLYSDSYSHPPPLTPPPSYYSNNMSTMQERTLKSSKQSYTTVATILQLRKKKKKNNHLSPSFSSSSTSSSLSSSSSSSFSSLPSSKKVTGEKKFYLSCSRSPVSYVKDVDHVAEDEGFGSPISTLCFGSKHRDFSSSVMSLKKALVSVLGNGSDGAGSNIRK